MSGIDYARLRSLPAQRLTRALKNDGFAIDRQSGSHRLYRHPDGRRVTVSFHRSSDTFPPKTLKSMIEVQAQWDETDLRRLGLLK
ncbi:MAG: type II toxin-antitoxin system HicA family toxin [Desulfobacterales bacterium]|nr:type II toxin-antitoxin system HicA family toxin [Desulfobacterales bacterium]